MWWRATGAGVDVGADAHLPGRADEHGDLTVAAPGEEAGAGFVVAGVVDERHLACGHAVGEELAAQLVVGGPFAVGAWGREVAEHDLEPAGPG